MQSDKIRAMLLVLVLVFVSALTHHYVFTQKGILSAGDWVHFYAEAGTTLANYSVYIKSQNFGEAMSLPNNWPFYLVASNLMQAGFSFDFFTRVFFLIPIVLFTPIFSFLAFKRISGNLYAAFFATLIYCFNTFFLKLQLDWLTYASIWWIFALLVYLVVSYSQTKRLVYLPIISLISAIGIVYELRIMLVVFAFFGIYLVFRLFAKNFRDFFLISCAFALGVLMHSFWLLPIFFGNMYSDVITYASSSIFPSFFNIVDVLLLRSYQWSGGYVFEPFIKQQVDTLLFIVPFVAMLGLYSRPKYTKFDKSILKPLLVSLVIFAFLAKQANIPGTQTYKFLFENVPLFSLFRESSKFIIIVAFCISVFGGIGAAFIKSKLTTKHRYLAGFFTLLFTFLMLLNSVHYIDSSVGDMTKGVSIPSEYIVLKNYLVKDNEFSRVLWYPFRPRFAYYSQEKPAVLISSVQNHIARNDLFNNKNRFNRFLDYSSIKYIVVPSSIQKEYKYAPDDTRIEIEGYKYYGSKDKYLSSINRNTGLKNVPVNDSDLSFFKNEDYFPNIYTSKTPLSLDYNLQNPDYIKYKMLTPYLYEIPIDELGDNDHIHFSDAYSSNWNMLAMEKDNEPQINDKQLKLTSDKHIKNKAGLNTYIVDSKWIEQVKATFKNPAIYIFYAPQSYLRIGSYISALLILITLLALFVLLSLGFFKRQNTHPDITSLEGEHK